MFLILLFFTIIFVILIDQLNYLLHLVYLFDTQS